MADINSCISMIQQAEEELRKAVADLIVSSYKHGNTQNEVERYLDLCNRLFDISEELKKAPSETRQYPPHVSNENVEYPLCFVDGGSLYKVGLSEYKNKNGKQRRWWKKVSYDEAEKMMDSLTEQGDTPFRRSDLTKSTNAPDYRANIVITALRLIDAIEPAERNGFYRIKQGTPSEWAKTIRALPVRADLLTNSNENA